MTKNIEINEETHVVISRDTFNQFKAMGQVYMDLKAKGVELEQAPEALARFEELVAKYKVAYEVIMYCVLGLTGVFGLNNADGSAVRPEVLNQEENPLPGILKELGSIMTTGMAAEMNPKGDAAKKMAEKFAFFHYLTFVFQFYQQQQEIKIKVPAEFLTNLPETVKAKFA